MIQRCPRRSGKHKLGGPTQTSAARTCAASVLALLSLSGAARPGCAARLPVDAAETTAWNGRHFRVDVGSLVSRSDIVLERPNRLPSQAMPLGNGELGLAVWAPDGLTLQLNRGDTLPHRLSPGQVRVPGLEAMMQARDFRGRLDLYNGELLEQGGGITARVYVQPSAGMAVIDVTGADPHLRQSVELSLWPPRSPRATRTRHLAMLAETWRDTGEPGASGRRFGSLSGLAAEARSVAFASGDARSVVMSFLPLADGRFRIFIPSPGFDGRRTALAAVSEALSHRSARAHRLWWNRFWQRAAMLQITSADGSGEYMENLRAISLFTAAAERGQAYPNSQAGVAELFSASRDTHRWDPAAFWHLNLSMQVAANLGAGLAQLNAAYFRLYRDNLRSIEAWTRQHMDQRPGACIPETMRFNGLGIEYETDPLSHASTVALNCDAHFKPFFNARTLSTGAEVSLWIWRQYLATHDSLFLKTNYPVMAAAARFLLAAAHLGDDGYDHTAPSNAHETQWDTSDPTTDIAARMALYAATIDAARLLGTDPALVRQLRLALRKIPPFPRTQPQPPLTLLPSSADATRADVIADSYQPAAQNRNTENIGLYPVWPFDLIGDTSPLFALARRTFASRPYPVYPEGADWSFDPIQAARLEFPAEVRSTLIELTELYQKYPNGLANWGGASGEFYMEQAAVTADALQEALVQDYDGLLRIAPALPAGWDFAGSVFVRGRTKVDVQTRAGTITTLVIESGSRQHLRLRNPWPGRQVSVEDAGSSRLLLCAQSSPEIAWAARARHTYRVYPAEQARLGAKVAPLIGQPAQAARHLGRVAIGLPSLLTE